MATLAELARQYLAQALPDISGIFRPREDAPVEDDPVEETTPGITPQLLQPMGGGGGDGFSVYNPDPTRTRTNYINPFPFNKDDNLGFSDYGYPEVPKKGLAGLFETYVKGSPLVQFANKGLTAFGNMLPVNPRGILENELIGQGLMLDDIGRIVTNNYNTPEGIMAGYNAAQMDASTFDDRIAKIQETINRKTAANPNYDPSNLLNRIDLINQAKDIFLGAKKSSRVIEDQKLRDKGLTPLSDQIAMNQAKLDFQQLVDEGEEEQELLDFLGVTDPNAIPTGITAASFPGVGLNRRNIVDIQDTIERINRAREKERQRAAEAAFAAAGGDRQQQAMQRARDQQAIDRAYRDETGAGSSYSGGERTRGDDTSYSDPFDPGGGE